MNRRVVGDEVRKDVSLGKGLIFFMSEIGILWRGLEGVLTNPTYLLKDHTGCCVETTLKGGKDHNMPTVIV